MQETKLLILQALSILRLLAQYIKSYEKDETVYCYKHLCMKQRTKYTSNIPYKTSYMCSFFKQTNLLELTLLFVFDIE